MIYVAGVPFAFDWPHASMTDGPYFMDSSSPLCNARVADGPVDPSGKPRAPAAGITGTARFRTRRVPRTYDVIRSYVRQFVVHLDGCRDARMCFDVLQNERGLSVHFIVDNDGTIYQTLDLADCAYHANGMNETSIGVELCNRGEAAGNLGYYANAPHKRDVRMVNIQGDDILAFDFTTRQLDAMAALGGFLAKVLPNIALDHPNNAGAPIYRMLHPEDKHNEKLRSYSGYLAHYHTNAEKWDPGTFDFKAHLGRLRGRKSFPIGLHALGDEAVVPDAKHPDLMDRAIRELYDNNEQEGGGGFYPVGPFDRHRVWHGGVHLHRERGTKVIAPWAGRVVAARNAPPVDGIGSTSFVLLEHSMKVSESALQFYSLYFHLEQVTGEGPKWMRNKDWRAADPRAVVTLPAGEPVQAGDVIGLFGEAGPDLEPQLHWEVFAVSHEPVAQLDAAGSWRVVDGGADRRFCKQHEILDRLDVKPKDGQISDGEAEDYFRNNPDRDFMRWVAAYHVSEWTLEPDWLADLREAPEYRKVKPSELARLVDEQITPALWWSDEVALQLGLPADGMVYTYHPVSFLRWLNDLTESAPPPPPAYNATKRTSLKTDLDDTSGSSSVDKDEVAPPAPPLLLRDLVEGYGE
jgi:murein DD-endopeptidase MepM/ murein hydrolase activator NlpD